MPAEHDAVIITGAARGLGRSLALGLADEGRTVVALARDGEALDNLASAATGDIRPVVGDARSPEALEAAVDAADGRLFAVVANAGIAGPTSPLIDLSDEDWSETLDVNLTATFRLFRAAGRALVTRGEGRMIAIGSATGKRPLWGRTPYAASKLGLLGLVRSLALELGPFGVTANVISPWLLRGPRLDGVIAAQAKARGVASEVVRAELVGGTAIGRETTDDDILGTVRFLLSPAADAITGQDINVSAGAVMY